MARRPGFTLVELLIVVAIIAILAAILFPVMNSAKQRALAADCVNNLREIGVATSLYMTDDNGVYPPYLIADQHGQIVGGWYYAAQKYSKTAILTRCPADAAAKKDDKAAGYWRNVYTDYWSGLFPNNRPPLDSTIVYKRSTVYLMDGPAVGPKGNWRTAQHTWWGPPTMWSGPGTANYKDCYDAEHRHSGGANVLFCDWHVQLVKPGEFKTKLSDGMGNPLARLPQVISQPAHPWELKNDCKDPWFRGD